MVSYELKFSVIPAVVVTTTHSGSLNLVSSQGAIDVSDFGLVFHCDGHIISKYDYVNRYSSIYICM